MGLKHHQINREMQVKATMRYHLTPVRMAIIEKTKDNKGWWRCGKKREPLRTVSENVNWCSHCGKQYGGFSKKLKIGLPYGPAMPLMGTCPREMKSVSQRDSWTPIFITALFIIVRIWKQPMCLSTGDWIKIIWYTYTMEYYLAL